MNIISSELQTFQRIPLSALSLKTRNDLASYLDAMKILPTCDGFWRDWRGLSQLSRLPNHYVSYLSSKSCPTIELIQILEKEPDPITFSDFRYMLGIVDRWDVFDDTYELFVADSLDYLNEKEPEKNNQSQQQQYVDPMMIQEMNPDCLTIDDVISIENGLPLPRYDVFLLFSPADNGFATEMIRKIETFGLKLCVKERDFLGGLPFEHDAIRNLLTKRCNRLVVILSPDFLNSALNNYTSNLAQSLGIAQSQRKLIPCLYKPCKVPEIFKEITLLDYEQSKIFNNFWKKLETSLQTTAKERKACQPNSVTGSDHISISGGMRSSTNSSLPSYGSFRRSKSEQLPAASSSPSSIRRSASQPLTSSFNSLQSTSQERLAYQCPPNSVTSSDVMSIADGMQSSTYSVGSSERIAYQCPPNSVTGPDDTQSSTGTSFGSYESFRQITYQRPPNSVTESDHMSISENHFGR